LDVESFHDVVSVPEVYVIIIDATGDVASWMRDMVTPWSWSRWHVIGLPLLYGGY